MRATLLISAAALLAPTAVRAAGGVRSCDEAAALPEHVTDTSAHSYVLEPSRRLQTPEFSMWAYSALINDIGSAESNVQAQFTLFPGAALAGTQLVVHVDVRALPGMDYSVRKFDRFYLGDVRAQLDAASNAEYDQCFAPATACEGSGCPEERGDEDAYLYCSHSHELSADNLVHDTFAPIVATPLSGIKCVYVLPKSTDDVFDAHLPLAVWSCAQATFSVTLFDHSTGKPLASNGMRVDRGTAHMLVETVQCRAECDERKCAAGYRCENDLCVTDASFTGEDGVEYIGPAFRDSATGARGVDETGGDSVSTALALALGGVAALCCLVAVGASACAVVQSRRAAAASKHASASTSTRSASSSRRTVRRAYSTMQH